MNRACELTGVIVVTVLGVGAHARAQPAPPASTAPAPPPSTAPADPYGQAPGPRAPDRPPIDFPEVLTTPTGWLLPAAVLYSKNALDTGGGVTSDTRFGLGDVA
jgi:hypothetical protein